MLLSVLNLFREKLPCSENFWRYKRNYELHIKALKQQKEEEESEESKMKVDKRLSPQLNDLSLDSNTQKRVLASPKMSKIRPLSPYM